MIEAILNLLMMVIGLAAVILWVVSLADSDGKCHYDDCEYCPYEWDCPMKEEKRKSEHGKRK